MTIKTRWIFLLSGWLSCTLAWADKPTFYPVDVTVQPMNNITVTPMTNITVYPEQESSLSRPLLISPMGKITDKTLTYQWNAVSSATHYHLWVENTKTQTQIINQQYSSEQLACSSNTVCEMTISDSVSGNYRWKVLAMDSTGNKSAWTEFASFSVENTTLSSTSYTDYFYLKTGTPVTFDASVHYKTRDGTAVAGVDYIATEGTATISAGQTSVDIGVEVLIANTGKTFSLVISDPKGAKFPTGMTEIAVTHSITTAVTETSNNN